MHTSKFNTLTESVKGIIADAVKYQDTTNLNYAKGIIQGALWLLNDEDDKRILSLLRMEIINLEMILQADTYTWTPLFPKITNDLHEAMHIIEDGEAHGFEFKISDGKIFYREIGID